MNEEKKDCGCGNENCKCGDNCKCGSSCSCGCGGGSCKCGSSCSCGSGSCKCGSGGRDDLRTFIIALLTALVVLSLYHIGTSLYCSGKSCRPVPPAAVCPVQQCPVMNQQRHHGKVFHHVIRKQNPAPAGENAPAK